ncbi:MAG: hypothetical protein H7343_21495 [Undibacterium sp.]|nr:hypothetical protein [Opitutaceae bacterium]
MPPRRLPLVLGLLLLLGILAWWLFPRPTSAPALSQLLNHKSKIPPAPPMPLAAKIENRESKIENPPPVSAAFELNSPRYDVAHDLVLLNDVFNNWRLDFPRTGNPFGGNSDITAALVGDNPLRLPYIPRSHPAINAAGELCDRWGTPFRFHALAGDRMELRSAGPDKKFGTPDDALLTPP